MQVGIFLPTMSHASVLSTASPDFVPDWFLMRETALQAEHYGFDFLLAPVKLRGFDGLTGFWNDTLDSVAVTAGLAAVTSRIRLYASFATLTVPPALAAKQAATLSDMAHGRFGVNIVTGWEKPEYAQMGLWPGDSHFASRYQHAAEFVSVMKELWTEGRSSFKGRFFQLEDCRLGPRPAHPVELVCAGQSDTGITFAAEHCDVLFSVGKADVAEAAQQIGHAMAVAARVRPLEVLPLYTVVQRDSTTEALETIDRWVEHTDLIAAANMRRAAGIEPGGSAEGSRERRLGPEVAMLNIGVIAGDARTVADHLAAIGEIDGCRGLTLTFQDYPADVARFGRDVVPLLPGKRV